MESMTYLYLCTKAGCRRIQGLAGTSFWTVWCFRHQVLLRRQGHFYNRGSRPTCAGERHRVGLY